MRIFYWLNSINKRILIMGGMTQRPWTPTKRRGPIAAEFGSPGPACVALPPLLGNMFNEMHLA